jgi:HEAT repeat protein
MWYAMPMTREKTSKRALVAFLAVLGACATPPSGPTSPQAPQAPLTKERPSEPPAVPAASQKLLAILDSGTADEQLAAVKRAAEAPQEGLVPALVHVLSLDVDTHPIQHHAYACDALGTLAEQQPGAIPPEAVRAVTLAVFFSNELGQSLRPDCGLAVQQIGESAVPELLAIFEGKREDVQTLLAKYDQHTSYPPNHAKLIAASSLAKLRASDAVPFFVAFLRGPHTPPSGLKDRKAVDWRLREGHVMSEVILGLGEIGGSEQVEILRETLRGQRVHDEWTEVTDWAVELELRQNAATALNALGDRTSTDLLLDLANTGRLEGMEKRFAMLEGQTPWAVSELQRYQFNWMSVRSAALLSDGTDLARFEAVIAANTSKRPELAKKMESFLPSVQLAARCAKEANNDAAAICYADELGNANPEIQAKAAWELGRLPPASALPVIETTLASASLEVREILTFHLYRMPNAGTVAVIDALLDDAPSENSTAHRLDRARLRLLRAWTVNHVEPKRP